MGHWTKYALAGILAVAAVTTTRAADLPFPPPEPSGPEPIEFGGNWYLRGDVGIGVLDFSKSVARDASNPPAAYTYNKVQDTVSDQILVGVGVGYQFNSWLRFDVTGEYRSKSDWRFIAEDTTFGASGGYNLESGHFSTVVGLGNVYFDLFHYAGMTGFVGGGAGFAHHMFNTTTDQGLGAYSGGFGVGPARDKTEFAWALHAGLAYDVSPNLKLELAYRYLNMGDAKTGSVGCLPTCALQTVYTVKDLESHDIKLGMRWMFGGPVGYEQPPLIRKY